MIRSGLPVIIVVEEIDGLSFLHRLQKIFRQQLLDHFGFNRRHRVEIPFDRVPRERPKSRLSAKHPWRPVQLGIPMSKGIEQRPAQRFRNIRAAAVFN